MKRKFKLMLTLCLTVCALAALSTVRAAETQCVVVGADLTAEEIDGVYSTFGLERGSVTELTLTNAEERDYLQGLVEESLIGTRSLSCVYILRRDAGAGVTVSTHNVTWCTRDMYGSALETAGITDVAVMVTAPCAVSGTAALAGVFKAYESVIGQELDEAGKQVGTQELVTTAELAEELGEGDAASLVSELKLILTETENMTDDELRQEITSLAGSYGLTLNDSQTRQLLDLCRKLESLGDSELVQKVEDIQETVKKLGETAEKVGEARDTVSGILEDVQGFLGRLLNFLSGLLGGA